MKTRYGLPLIIFLAATAFAAEQPYQDQRDDYPDVVSGHPLIQLDLKAGAPKVSYLRYEEGGGYTRDRFEARTVPAGKELGIRGYWISKSLIDAYRKKFGKEKDTFFKGVDAPGYEEIFQVFRQGSDAAFSEMLGRLTELRRAPESEAEAAQVQRILDPKGKKDISEFFGQLAFGTGMIEVEDPHATGKDARLRRFIPLSLLKSGQVSLDPARARIQILQSIVVTVLSDSTQFLQDASPIESQAVRLLSDLGCRSTPCGTNGRAFAEAAEMVLKVGLVDHATRFDILDPKYEQKLDRAESEKLRRIVSELKRICFP
ncbi:MAG: hypothetical protein NDJ89_06135 [Oligoflexia bacterium]|nr:hypothetical protein [Oligoflexia bacterium]